jgi:hypothetical protein
MTVSNLNASGAITGRNIVETNILYFPAKVMTDASTATPTLREGSTVGSTYRTWLLTSGSGSYQAFAIDGNLLGGRTNLELRVRYWGTNSGVTGTQEFYLDSSMGGGTALSQVNQTGLSLVNSGSGSNFFWGPTATFAAKTNQDWTGIITIGLSAASHSLWIDGCEIKAK